jgi:DNA-binding MarR family transcriptional regulator
MTTVEMARGSTDEAVPARLRIAVARLSRRLRPTAAAGSLTATEVDVLKAAERRGPRPLSDLAEFVGLNPTMLSRLVQKLETSGLVRRLPDEADKRVCRLEVSPKGRRLLERINRERNDVLSRLITSLAKEDRVVLERALPILEQLADELRQEPTAPPGEQR